MVLYGFIMEPIIIYLQYPSYVSKISMSEATTNYLYRPQIYQQELHRQHVDFLRLGLNSYLTIPNPNNQLHYVALLNSRSQRKVIAQLNNKEQKTQFQHLFFIVALKLAGQSYYSELSEFKRCFPHFDHSEQIEKYVDYFSKITPPVATSNNKQSIRYQFDKLMGKANNEGYYTIPDVPVFLVSTKWLEQLYSTSLDTPTPVANEILLESVAFPIAEQNYMHYNYRIRQDMRENIDFKLVSYEAWQLLYKTYGGFEVRRFTTKEKQPIVDVWLINASILIVEDRCVFHRVEIQVSKGDTLTQLLERVKKILKRYKIVPDKYLDRAFTLYKSRELSEKEVVSVLHDDSQPFITSANFERIADFNLQIQEAGILTPHDYLILNLTNQKGIFSRLPTLKVISVRDKCLNCGTYEDLIPCKCRTVFFCSPKCKDNQQSHQKQCDSFLASSRKLNLVVEHYAVKKRSFPELKKLHEIGKVGLENLGNTCYMNSALQCLVRLADLSEFFLQNRHLKDLNVVNVLGSEGHIACAYGQFVKNFYASGKKVLQPSDILRCIQKNPQFRGFNHQDSQEFLNYFLDKLHEDLNKVKVKPYTEEVESNGRPDEIVSKLSWQNYKKRNDSFISDLFAGQYRSKIMCPDCKKISITFDPFLSVTLQFPRPQKGEDLEGYFMTEEGEFQRFKVQAKSTMPTFQFYKKFFHKGVQGATVKDKKLFQLWDPTKSLFQNKKGGLMFFYEQPSNLPVQIIIQFFSANKETPEYLPRMAFAKDIQSQEDIIKAILLVIRNPFKKVLQKDITDSEYLALCLQKNVIKIRSLTQNGSTVTFPIIEAGKTLKAKVELLYQTVTAEAPKLSTASKSDYRGLQESLVKKVKEELTMKELINCFSEPEQLTEDNTWYCSSCKGHKLADKAMSLYSLPEYLIIHLKRFNHRGNRYVIYGQKVNTPILLQEFQVIKDSRYELLGVVNHFGSLVHGHYTASVKRDDWYCYDDSRCSKTRLDGKNAYLLFYRRVQ